MLDQNRFEVVGKVQGEIDDLVFECEDNYNTSTVNVTVTEKLSG